MKEQPAPSLPTSPRCWPLGSADKLTAAQYAFEGKFDGYRLLVEVDHGDASPALPQWAGHDQDYPQLQSLAADLAEHAVILDGEVVALDGDGVPNFGEMQNRSRASRIEFWAFDIPVLDGRSLLRAKYRDRRRVLETFAEGTDLIVPHCFPGTARRRWSTPARRSGGVVAKRWDSTYQPGRRSAAWIRTRTGTPRKS